MPDGRVLIALDDPPLEPTPSWTRLDNTPNLVSGYDITTGRQDEFDTNGTGTATVFINDTAGLFDRFNTGSAFFGKDIVGAQVLLQIYNPVDTTWYSRFKGTVDEIGFEINPATANGESILSNVQLRCLDRFDYLAGAQVTPGINGDPAPDAAAGSVFYEDGEVNNRITQVLDEFGFDPDDYVCFEGNVMVQETLYDPGDSALIVLRDAADAEAPAALGNLYVDRHGRVVFHGRQSRIDPDTVAAGAGAAWDFNTWYIGDGAAIAGDSNYAQIREPFNYNISRSKMINRALITPRGIKRETIPTLVVEDAGLISVFGIHSFNYPDSINNGHKTNGDTAAQDCQRSAEYLVNNYGDPRVRVEQVTVRAMEPDDPRAAKTWEVLCKSDISDRVVVKVGYAGGTGLEDSFYLEGWTQSVRALNTEFDWVEWTGNISPQTNFDPYDDAFS